ncbi:hypothetical protein [Agathobaculum butyriciproducens]
MRTALTTAYTYDAASNRLSITLSRRQGCYDRV